MSDSASVFDPQLLRTHGPESANVPRAGPGALRESSTFGGCASPNASMRSTARFFCDDQHSLSEGVFRYITACVLERRAAPPQSPILLLKSSIISCSAY